MPWWCLSNPPFPLKLFQEFPRKIAMTTPTRPISLYLGSVSGALSWRNVFSTQPPFQLMELSLATYSLYHSLSLASTGHPWFSHLLFRELRGKGHDDVMWLSAGSPTMRQGNCFDCLSVVCKDHPGSSLEQLASI